MSWLGLCKGAPVPFPPLHARAALRSLSGCSLEGACGSRRAAWLCDTPNAPPISPRVAQPTFRNPANPANPYPLFPPQIQLGKTGYPQTQLLETPPTCRRPPTLTSFPHTPPRAHSHHTIPPDRPRACATPSAPPLPLPPTLRPRQVPRLVARMVVAGRRSSAAACARHVNRGWVAEPRPAATRHPPAPGGVGRPPRPWRLGAARASA